MFNLWKTFTRTTKKYEILIIYTFKYMKKNLILIFLVLIFLISINIVIKNVSPKIARYLLDKKIAKEIEQCTNENGPIAIRWKADQTINEINSVIQSIGLTGIDKSFNGYGLIFDKAENESQKPELLYLLEEEKEIEGCFTWYTGSNFVCTSNKDTKVSDLESIIKKFSELQKKNATVTGSARSFYVDIPAGEAEKWIGILETLEQVDDAHRVCFSLP